jgi:hypothetical protein
MQDVRTAYLGGVLIHPVSAYGIALWRIELFFPAILFVIGGRHLTFATLFGTKLFWICGGVLGGAIEIVFGIIVLAALRGTTCAAPASA